MSDKTFRNVLFTMIMSGLLFTGAGCSRQKGKKGDKDEPKQEVKKQDVETFQNFKERMWPLTPSVMLETILAEGTELDDKGLCKPYRKKTKKNGKVVWDKWTIGFGLTELDGKPVTENTRHITIQEAFEKSVKFLENKETYFFMWCYEIGMDGLNIDTDGKAMCLASIIYNSGTKIIENPNNQVHKDRNAELRALYKQYGDSVTVDQVKALFVKYPISASTSFGCVLDGGSVKQWADALGGFVAEGGGIYWRRWLEGQIAMGNITPDELLNLPDRGMSDFYKVMGSKKSAFFVDHKINMETLAKFKEWAKHPVDKHGNTITRRTLRQMLYTTNTLVDNQATDAEVIKNQDVETVDLEGDFGQYSCNELNDMSYIAYQGGDYETALEAGKAALKVAETNKQRGAATYNIGITYLAIEKYEKAVHYLRLSLAENKTKAAEDALQQAVEKRNQRRINYGIGTGLVLGLGAFGFRRIKKGRSR